VRTFRLVSVVMPSLNQARFIDAAIDSVLNQNYPNIELIVADGGSDDGTVDLLKNRQAVDCRIRWFLRKDGGPAEAINAALALVRGTIVNSLLESVHDLLSKSVKKAKWTNCKLVLSLRSQFFHKRRHFSSQAKDRSTIHRCGITLKVCSSLRLAT